MHCLGVAQKCREIDKSMSVHQLDHESRPLAGAPALVEFNKSPEEESLFSKMSLKTVHDVTLSVSFCFHNCI